MADSLQHRVTNEAKLQYGDFTSNKKIRNLLDVAKGAYDENKFLEESAIAKFTKTEVAVTVTEMDASTLIKVVVFSSFKGDDLSSNMEVHHGGEILPITIQRNSTTVQ